MKESDRINESGAAAQNNLQFQSACFLEARIKLNETVRRIANGRSAVVPGWGDILTHDVMGAYRTLASAAVFAAGFGACTGIPRILSPEGDGSAFVFPAMALGGVAAALTSEYLKDRHEQYIRRMGLTAYARIVGPQNVAQMPWYLGHVQHAIERGAAKLPHELDTRQ